MCHEWVGLSSALPQMDEAGEAGLLSLVISNLAAAFRWKLDDKPDFCRSSGAGPANSAAVLPTTHSLTLSLSGFSSAAATPSACRKPLKTWANQWRRWLQRMGHNYGLSGQPAAQPGLDPHE